MNTFDPWLLRIEATKAWLEYTKLFPKSDIDIYDFNHSGYSFEEAREIFLNATASRTELFREQITKKAMTTIMP
jgi:hypothetical protein